MEQPFPKRRRLSPPGSAGAKSVTRSAKSTSNGAKASSGSRPSFISPTKASLSRFNPDLLPPPQSSEPRKSPRKNPGTRTPTSNVKETEKKVNGDASNRKESEPSRANRDNTNIEEKDVAPTPRSGLSAAPRRRSRTPNTQAAPKTQSVYGTRGSKLAASKSVRQSEGGALDDNLVTTQRDRLPNGVVIDQSSLDKLPATPTPYGIPAGAAKGDSVEPSLPSTPTQLGLEAPSQRPKGLLFGTPSKVAKLAQKQKNVHDILQRQQEETMAEQPFATEHPSTLQLGAKVFLEDMPKPPPSPEQMELLSKTTKCTDLERNVLNLGSNVLKDSISLSWEEPTAKESAGLQKQQKKLTDLAERLNVLREEIQDLRTLIDHPEDGTTGDPKAGNESGNLNAIGLSKLSSLPRKLTQFLPFPSNDTAQRMLLVTDEENFHSVKHIKITNSNLEGNSSDPDFLPQSHDTCFMSENAVVEENVRIRFDSRSLQILDVSLLPLVEFSANPGIRPILEEWIREKSQSIELISIGRAVNRTMDVVKKRDKCWRACRERFSDLFIHEPPKKRATSDDEVVLRRKDMSLTIGWTIILTDEGEAQSELSILTEFPQAWWEERILAGREIEDVRAAFGILVGERGVTEAIAEIVKLLFPDEY